jgi:cyclopropane fatty-acyl-phospholipid synthase-like methyltransferase
VVCILGLIYCPMVRMSFAQNRIFSSCQSILEIAPGYGRWTRFLVGLCDRLTLIDLAENCILHCRERFKNCHHIEYVVNDGKSLSMVPDRSVDLLFSFDSVVHADLTVIDSYIRELPRILTDDGVAFLHHSNAKEFKGHFHLFESLPRGQGFFHRLGVSDQRHLRNVSVSGDDLLHLC